MGDTRCDHELGVDIDKPWATRYFCELAPGHNGLHRWSAGAEDGRARVWFDAGGEIIDFLEGPYEAASDPASLTCPSWLSDASGTTVFCVRPKGHVSKHGNHHTGEGPTLWADDPDVPSTYGTLTEPAKTPEGAHIPARFEIVIDSGHKAIARKVRLNGLELPNVHDLSVEYGPSNARTVIVEILATDIIEVTA